MFRRLTTTATVATLAFATSALADAPTPQCCSSPKTSSSKSVTRTPRPIVVLPAVPAPAPVAIPSSESTGADAKVILAAANSPAVELAGILCSANSVSGQAADGVHMLIVKQKGRAAYYYLDDKRGEETYSSELRGGVGKYATITGTVTEKDGKYWVSPQKVVLAAN